MAHLLLNKHGELEVGQQMVRTEPFKGGRIQTHTTRCSMRIRDVLTSAWFFAMDTSVRATTFSQFAHNVKEEALHAGKVVGGDVSHGVSMATTLRCVR